MKRKKYIDVMVLSILLFLCFPHKILSEIWEKDMSEEIYIEASRDGFEFISLDCLEKHFQVTLELEEPFDGVFYTRGSYKQGKPPCYFHGDGSTLANLKIPYDGCKTVKKDGNYTNTVILQHDEFLMFPGDSAFELNCWYEKELKVASSSIGLADPDPGAKELSRHKKSTVFGENNVVFTPGDVRPRMKADSTNKKERKKVKSENIQVNKKPRIVKKELREEL